MKNDKFEKALVKNLMQAGRDLIDIYEEDTDQPDEEIMFQLHKIQHCISLIENAQVEHEKSKTFGEMIKKLANRENVSMAEISSRVGRAKSWLSIKLREGGRFSDEEMEKIAEAVGYEYRCYFEYEDGTVI